MQIERFEFIAPSEADRGPTVLGLNIQRKNDRAHVNLFSLSENRGALVSTQFWGIANKIISDVLLGQRVEDVQWHFISSYRKSALRFFTMDGSPYRLEISDLHASQFENHRPNWSWDIAKYEAEYDGATPRHKDDGQAHRHALSAVARALFTIPCNNPVTKGCIYYCVPSFYDSEHMRSNFEFILADTKKVMAQLQQDDPEMLAHAARKFKGSEALRWLKASSVGNPSDMGLWSYNKSAGLQFCSGQAALLEVARELALPYIPIAVDKNTAPQDLAAMKSKIAYKPDLGPGIVPFFRMS